MTTPGATISQAADSLGLSTDTLRYYERDQLLLRAVPREPNGHRRYQQTDLGWIELITRLRATGMPIRDIRRYAALVRGGDGNETERLELLQAHRRRVLAQLAEVTENLAAIDHKIALYTDRLGRRARSA
jgi:DNA-binding transcriptional MerR regulator